MAVYIIKLQMKRLTYLLLIVIITFCFSGCKRNNENEYIFCSPENKENKFCNYDLNPVCWDNWQTYWNSCVACINQVNSYKLWECKICDEETGICSLWDFQKDDFYEEWEIDNLEPKEIFIGVPTPNF